MSVEIKAGYRSGTKLTFPPTQAFPRIVTFTLKEPNKHPVFGLLSEMTSEQKESVSLPDTEWMKKPGLLILRRTLMVSIKDVTKGKSFDVPTIDGASREVTVDPTKVQDILAAGPGHSKEVHLLVKGAGMRLSSRERTASGNTRGDLLVTINIIS